MSKHTPTPNPTQEPLSPAGKENTLLEPQEQTSGSQMASRDTTVHSLPALDETSLASSLDPTLLLDPALERQLTMLAPKASQIPSAEQALQVFRKNHYQTPPSPQPVTSWWQRLLAWFRFDRSRGRAIWSLGMTGAIAAVALAIALPFPTIQMTTTPHQSSQRTAPQQRRATKKKPSVYMGKGRSQWIMLFAKAGNLPGGANLDSPTRQSTKQASRNQRLSPKDLIQFVYQLPQDRHLMIINVTAKGTIAACAPFLGKTSIKIKAGKGTQPNNASMELDHSMGYERFYIITSSQPFSLAQVKTSFQRTWQRARQDIKKANEIPGPWSVNSFLIHKEAPSQP